MEKGKQIQAIIQQYLFPLHEYGVRQQCEARSHFNALAHIFGLKADICEEFDPHGQTYVSQVLIRFGVTPLSKIRPRKGNKA